MREEGDEAKKGDGKQEDEKKEAVQANEEHETLLGNQGKQENAAKEGDDAHEGEQDKEVETTGSEPSASAITEGNEEEGKEDGREDKEDIVISQEHHISLDNFSSNVAWTRHSESTASVENVSVLSHSVSFVVETNETNSLPAQ
ncbi:uncharacterized protein N7459_007955 [Penicillium hispanicum]|uniref:uncharacterized protein n=1 Tax=Penicillium hispanicum TaxID=1080232 RepID=UPI002540A05E|nr:uncharacterized protein N7459_007955 [Penicillium hispanicum]KAJ5573528.1 hypothetical protein N7459_007955 [Penicillium hispanicum]